MKNRNENQSRHIANSLRVLGMAGFAAFGYPAISKGDIGTIVFFIVLYGLSEFTAYKVLKTQEK